MGIFDAMKASACKHRKAIKKHANTATELLGGPAGMIARHAIKQGLHAACPKKDGKTHVKRAKKGRKATHKKKGR